MNANIRRIPSLDGIRASAACLVFASHAFAFYWIPGGLGVTVFFFLSGFLITTLLRNEYTRTGGISLKAFYVRRSCRIFPPMYFMLLLILGITLISKGAAAIHGGALLSQFAHLTNYTIVSLSDEVLLPDTAVFWSLAVEEHFYLIFPALFLWLVQGMSLRRVAQVLFALCIAVLVWRIVMVQVLHVPGPHIYYSTDSRFDSILYGCIMGVWLNPVLDFPPATSEQPEPAHMVLMVLGVLLLAFTLIYRNDWFQQTLRYSLQGVALFPMFWLAIRYPRWAFFRWLNWRPIVWLGVVSYTFYLSHKLWLSVAQGMAPGVVGAVVGFALTLAFSSALYWRLERPFLALGHGFATRQAPSGLKEPI